LRELAFYQEEVLTYCHREINFSKLVFSKWIILRYHLKYSSIPVTPLNDLKYNPNLPIVRRLSVSCSFAIVNANL
jgi:hypothetical protein